MLERIIDRVILEAKKAGKLGPKIDTSYEITFPEIDSGENFTLAQATNQLVTALANAASKGWVSDETAMRIMFEFAGEEIDVAEEMAKIVAERTAKLAAMAAIQKGQPVPVPPAPGQRAPVPNQQALDRQSAQETDPLGKLNAYGNPASGAVTYSELYGQGGIP